MKVHDRKAVEGALQHWNEVFGLAMVLVRDRGIAEDLCQEAYLRFGERDLDRTAPARPLLLKIVRNLALNERRRPTAISLESHVDAGAPIADLRSTDPAEEATRQETIRSVRRALKTLSPLWQSVLYLRDGVGLGYAEIASILDKSEDVIRVTLHRARTRIRSTLRGETAERKCS